MAEKALARASLFFDELSKVRVIEPSSFELSERSIAESRQLTANFDAYQTHCQVLVDAMKSLASVVETHKMAAIATRNALHSQRRDEEAHVRQLGADVAEKNARLQRIVGERQSLQTHCDQQQDYIDMLRNND